MYTVLFMHMYVDITYECVYVEIGKSREHYIYIYISPCVLCAQSTSCTVICIRVSEKILELP